MDHRVQMAIDFMTARLKQPLPLSKLARTVNLSVPHFSKLFRTDTDKSPGQYLMMLRMQKAAELLAGSDLTVKEVMAKVGFNDKSDFVRSFKKTHGISPSDYRRKRRKSAHDSTNHKID